jgi:membrane protein DedA with SNARE-associated domain
VVQSWEQSALLVVMSLVFAERALGRTRVPVGVSLVAVGVLTTWSGGLPLVAAWCWLVIAAAAGDQVAHVAGRPSGRDPLRLLRRAHSAIDFAAASVVGAAAWAGGLLTLGWVAGEVGKAIGHPWTIGTLVALGCLFGSVRCPGQPTPVGMRRR